MELSIGENIKRLRAEQSATQEKLADFLGVTTRAVSKWETGKAYPDITLLHGISGFFGVTLDELMEESSEAKNKTRITELNMKILDNRATGKHEENIKLLRKAVKQYPNEFALQLTLADSLVIISSLRDVVASGKLLPSDEIREAAAICERVLKLCTDDTLRHAAAKLAYLSYEALEDIDNVRAMFARIPILDHSNILMLPSYLSKDERKAVIQENIKKLGDAFANTCMQLADVAATDYGFGYSYEQKIAILQKVIDFYALLYENGDYGVSYSTLYTAYGTMARLAGNAGDAEHALSYLELAVKCTVAYEDRPLQPDLSNMSGMLYTAYTSILVDTRRDFGIAQIHMTENNLCWNLLNVSLPHEEFAKLRALIGDTERYKALIAELTARTAQPERESQNPLDFKHNLAKAEGGDENYMYLLASLYLQGVGVKKNMAEAVNWLKRAADKNHTAALNDLGELYAAGKGVEQDYSEALRLWKKANEVPTPFGIGNPYARSNIGFLYAGGLGVPQDYAEARRWYELSDEYNFPFAQYALGELYEKGLGVETDLNRALKYYEKAAAPNEYHRVPKTAAEIADYDTNTITRKTINAAIARVQKALQ
ncbi:MAG: helix-turn-helix domain-containing protein [Oscillospiraceae bacterium]|jgi:TPR repeat protein/transcriptional regulator with XRE-family HTH domain|nr:helix-turn-helix domain-containing protein [Oscillospiraceae bacterium]